MNCWAYLGLKSFGHCGYADSSPASSTGIHYEKALSEIYRAFSIGVSIYFTAIEFNSGKRMPLLLVYGYSDYSCTSDYFCWSCL